MRAKQLAQKLRRRCFENFGGVDDIVKNTKGREAGNIIIGTVSLYRGIDDYLFPITEVHDAYPYKTIWSCYIHVSKNLDVFVEEAHGKVPKDILACALGGR